MLIVLEVRGLTMEVVQRGDCAAHLFDLIAEGALAETTGLAPRIGEWIVETRLESGVEHLAAIDQRIRELRARGELAIVSDRVFIHPRPIPGLRPGVKLTPDEVGSHLRSIAHGP